MPSFNELSVEVWNTLQPDIERWYLREGKTQRNIAHELCNRGYHVKERMVRTRLEKWGLQQKNKKPSTKSIKTSDHNRRDAATHDNPWHSGIAITSSDVDSPESSWLRSRNPSQFAGGRPSIYLDQSDRVWNTNAPTRPLLLSSPETELPDGAGEESSRSIRRTSNPWVFVQDPVQDLFDQAVTNMRKYCDVYAISAESQKHFEPAVHRETKHAIFAQEIQDSLALSKVNAGQASTRLLSAFVTLEHSIRNPCPMNLALVMSVICNLGRQSAWHIQSSLLEQFKRDGTDNATISPVDLPIRRPGTSLVRSPNLVTDMILRCMREACHVLSSQLGRLTWKTLYVEERLCDCLYYMGFDGERIEARQALLEAQSKLYGPCTRNVLWTLTNVADDLLQQGRTLESEEAYHSALVRADAHENYDRAKTRFAALEGLADVWIARAGLRGWPSEGWGTVWHGTRIDWSALENVSNYLEAAEQEALTLFNSSGQRTLRVQSKKQSLLVLSLRSMG